MNTLQRIKILILILLIIPFSGAIALQHYGLNYCNQPGFSCFTVKRGQTWDKLWPNPEQQQIVRRLNRMNTNLYAGMVIAVPDNINNMTVMDISPFPVNIDAPNEKMVVVDPNVMAWGAYAPTGQLVRWGPISAGKNYCPDVSRYCRTVAGKFSFYHKEGKGCFSSKFPVGKGGAPMPFCMFFHGGYALHASYEVPGRNDSHGCVRLFLEDAEWLNKEFIDIATDAHKGTTLIINPYI